MNERIEEIVQRWGSAKTLEEAADIIRRSIGRLDRGSLEQIRRLVAEVAIEVLVIVLSNRDGTANVNHAGLLLTMHQSQRLDAWLEDQIRTGSALGLNEEQWKALLREVGGKTNHRDADALLGRVLQSSEDAIPVDWQAQMDHEWRQVHINMGPGGGGSYNRQHLAMGRFSMHANPHKTTSTLLPS